MTVQSWKNSKVFFLMVAILGFILLVLLVLPTLAIPSVLADDQSVVESDRHDARSLLQQGALKCC